MAEDLTCSECGRPPSAPFDMTLPPDSWCRFYSVHVHDPDGWRGEHAADWNEPVTLMEFERRALLSTIDVVNPRWDTVSRDARLCEQAEAYAALAGAQDDEDRGFHQAVRERRRSGEDD